MQRIFCSSGILQHAVDGQEAPAALSVYPGLLDVRLLFLLAGGGGEREAEQPRPLPHPGERGGRSGQPQPEQRQTGGQAEQHQPPVAPAAGEQSAQNRISDKQPKYKEKIELQTVNKCLVRVFCQCSPSQHGLDER